MEKDFHEITDPTERQSHLDRTGLSVQLAGYEPGEDVFLAAHGTINSILALRIGHDLTVWLVRGGTKVSRTLLADGIRAKLTNKPAIP